MQPLNVKIVPNNIDKKIKEKNNSQDRIIVLEPIDGEKVKDSTGLVDTRLFQGGNQLHALLNPMTSNWTLKYEKGGLPGPLKQKFTTYSALEKFVKDYFTKRGLKIKEVIT